MPSKSLTISSTRTWPSAANEVLKPLGHGIEFLPLRAAL